MSKEPTLLGAGVPSLSPGPGLKQEITETPQIKEEAEEQSVKQEEEQLPVSASEIITVCVKGEESSGDDIRSDTEGHKEHSSDIDNDDHCSAAKGTGRFSKSGPKTSASVNSDHVAGTFQEAKRKKHQCSVCDKRFRTKQHLKTHMRVHTGEKPYSCSICEKTFNQKSNLLRHTRMHTRGEKRHQCSDCRKKFRNKQDLLKHNRTHAVETHSCSLCMKTFTQKANLDSHGKTGDITFHCSVCEVDFTDSSSLKKHLKTHSELKPSSCSGSSIERRTAESEEELCGSWEEDQRKQQLLDSALMDLQHRAGVPSLSPGPGLKQEITETPQIKEEPEEQSVKQEEEQLPVPVSEIITVCVKREGSSGDDIRPETERHKEHSSDTDNDDHRSAAQSTGLFPKSAPENSAAVNNGHTSRAEGAEGRKHQCSVCKKWFATKQSLQTHSKVHTGEKPYSCSLCDKTFTQKSNLLRHLRIHIRDERKHHCSDCRKKCSNEHDLLKNNTVLTAERPFSCSRCMKTFTLKTNLTRHMKTHRGDITFSCSICEVDFTDSSSLKEHLITHTEEKPSSCLDSLFERRTAESEEELCGSKEENHRTQQLLDSARGPGALLPRAGVPSLSPGPGLNQEITETPQIKEEPEEQSVKQEEEQLPVPASESSLLQQRQTAPETGASVNNGHKSGAEEAERKKHQCSICNKRFVTKQVLQNHIAVHTGERIHRCPHCEKTFAQKGNLQSHMRTHTGERPFSCLICKKTFIQKSNVKAHMTLHTGERSYSCPLCQKTFAWKRSLKAHMATHTGERPFPCSICGKTFSQKSNLNTHMTTHRRESAQR